MLWHVYGIYCDRLEDVMPWVFVFVGYVDFAPPNRRDAVSFCWRWRCASVVCCGDNMFLHIACEAVSGGVVG